MKRAATYAFVAILGAACNQLPGQGQPGTVGVQQEAIGNAPTVPTGALFPFAGIIAPSGYLLCDGSIQNSANYPALYAIIGTTYGTGDGSSGSFNLPDLRGRTAFGKDDMNGTPANRLTATGSGVDGKTLGASGGAESHLLTVAEMPSHNHPVNDPGHAHGLELSATSSTQARGVGSGGGSFWGLVTGWGPWNPLVAPGANRECDLFHDCVDPTFDTNAYTSTSVSGTVVGAQTGVSVQNSGGGAAHPTTPPGVVLNYIIKN